MSETALAPITGPRGVALRDTADIERFATIVYKSTLVPKEYRNNFADVFGIIAFGMELGLNPMQSIQNIAWINSKPSVYGDMLLGLVEASGLLEEFEEVDPDEALREGIGRCTLKRRGRLPITRTFTKEMAETAKLWGKDIWRSYPGRMLQMRARSWALRDAFSDVLKGLYAREEAEDIVMSMDAKGTFTRPERQEPTALHEVLAEDQELTSAVHPTLEQVNGLVELLRSCGLDAGAHMREILGLSHDVKVTKNFIHEIMTVDQYDKAWMFYSDKLKEQSEDDVQDFPGPVASHEPSDDTQTSGEGNSGSEHTESSHEASSDIDEHAEWQAGESLEVDGPGGTIADGLEDFPDFELDDHGFLTQPGITLLVHRAQQHSKMAMYRKLKGEEPNVTPVRARYIWEQVGKKS
jgi:hypothetical protein